MNTIINIFDFDGTLTTDTWPKFWVWIKRFGYNGDFRNDELEKAIAEYRTIHKDKNAYVTFFGFFNDLLVSRGEKISVQELLEGEQFIRYNPGLKSFLSDTYFRSNIKNYILSSGLVEFLSGLSIAKYFNGIYGSNVRFDENGNIIGINVPEIMSDEKKILAIKQILTENGISKDDCSSVTYVGDGDSDGPSMRFVHENGGRSVFVHQPQNNNALQSISKMYELYGLSNKSHGLQGVQGTPGFVDYICEADYRQGSKLRNILESRVKY